MNNQLKKCSVLNKAIKYQNVLYIGTFCHQLNLIKVKYCFWNKHNPSVIHKRSPCTEPSPPPGLLHRFLLLCLLSFSAPPTCTPPLPFLPSPPVTASKRVAKLENNLKGRFIGKSLKYF